MDAYSDAGGALESPSPVDAPVGAAVQACPKVPAAAAHARSQARKQLIEESRAKAALMPPGEERNKILAAADRLAKLDHGARLAGLSAAVYQDTGAPPGFERLDAAQELGITDTAGMKYAMFKDADGNVVVAFQGTATKGDWIQNIGQLFGLGSEDYRQSMIVAQKAKSWAEAKNVSLEFTGHSKGGGQAMVAAAVTGAPATVYNPAHVNPDTVQRTTLKDLLRGDAFRSQPEGGRASAVALGGNMTSFVVDGEILDTAQATARAVNSLPLTPLPPLPALVAPLDKTPIPAQQGDGMFDRHSMVSVKKGMLGEMCKDVSILGGDPASMIDPADYESLSPAEPPPPECGDRTLPRVPILM
jgi:hypothetical protein